jgi:hypothetical protein
MAALVLVPVMVIVMGMLVRMLLCYMFVIVAIMSMSLFLVIMLVYMLIFCMATHFPSPPLSYINIISPKKRNTKCEGKAISKKVLGGVSRQRFASLGAAYYDFAIIDKALGYGLSFNVSLIVTATADEQRGATEERARAMKACTRRCGTHGPFLFKHYSSSREGHDLHEGERLFLI